MATAEVQVQGTARHIGKRTAIKHVGDSMLPDPIDTVQITQPHRALIVNDDGIGTLFAGLADEEYPLDLAVAAGVEIT